MFHILSYANKYIKFLINCLMYSNQDGIQKIKSASRSLADLSTEELHVFLNSFDNVIFDCDGVLWKNSVIIPGVSESLKQLERNGKKLYFLTNNSVKSYDNYKLSFQEVGINIQPENLLYPSTILKSYLKSMNFNKKLFVIGTKKVLNDLSAAGIECVVADNESPEDLKWFMEHIANNDDIGGVFIDFDINFNYLKMTKAISLLTKPDVLFFVGCSDTKIPVSDETILIGPGPLINIISDVTNRAPIIVGKPGIQAKEFALKQFNIKIPERTLFVGDSLDTDMAFANLCNFQKLLVLTGVTSAQDIIENNNNALNPNYILSSLAQMSTLFQNKN